MNFSEMRTEVFRRLDESSSSPVFWTVADVNKALNEGYETISDATEWFEDSQSLPCRSLTYHDLSAEIGNPLLTVKHCFNRATSRWLEAKPVRHLDEDSYRRWEQITGSPSHFFLRGLFWLGLYPRNNDVMLVRFTSLPRPLASDSDTPAFPQEFHYGLIEYALYDLYCQEAETKKGLTHWERYQGFEVGLSRYVKWRASTDRVSGFQEAAYRG